MSTTTCTKHRVAYVKMHITTKAMFFQREREKERERSLESLAGHRPLLSLSRLDSRDAPEPKRPLAVEKLTNLATLSAKWTVRSAD